MRPIQKICSRIFDNIKMDLKSIVEGMGLTHLAQKSQVMVPCGHDNDPTNDNKDERLQVEKLLGCKKGAQSSLRTGQ